MFTRPRFRFSLRALLVALTLAAVWLAWNANIVQRRRAVVATAPTVLTEAMRIRWKTMHLDQWNKIPWTRRVLGDEPVHFISLDFDATDAEVQEVRTLFPEATVRRGFPPAWIDDASIEPLPD